MANSSLVTNVTSSQTLNAALAGFAEAGSDGIVQVSTGGAEYLSGPTRKNMVAGSVAFAAYAHEVAKQYPVHVALHTDHCPKDKLDGYVRPLVAISTERVQRGGSFLCTDQYCTRYMMGTRGKGAVDTGNNNVGFRCVVAK